MINNKAYTVGETLLVVLCMAITIIISFPLVASSIENTKKNAHLEDLIAIKESVGIYCTYNGNVIADQICNIEEDSQDIVLVKFNKKAILSDYGALLQQYIDKDLTKIADEIKCKIKDGKIIFATNNIIKEEYSSLNRYINPIEINKSKYFLEKNVLKEVNNDK